ncbi:uridine cytidine kinase i [Gorgonomyces haynaldii]|nr:uridine cytidine kinase i [Gorgonomyces haynaldii]
MQQTLHFKPPSQNVPSQSVADMLAIPNKPILIAGGSACGKTRVCNQVFEKLVAWDPLAKVVMLNMEEFYKQLGPKELKLAEQGEYNFDHPDAIDFPLLDQVMRDLLQRKAVKVPVYDKKTHLRLDTHTVIENADVIIMSGIHMLYDRKVRDMLDLKCFVDVDSDVRLSRQVLAATSARRNELDQILNRYVKFIKPSFEEFILPTKKYADIIIPRGGDNTVAIDLLAQHAFELRQY